MSPAAKAFYNQLIAEKVTNPAFRIELVEYYYSENLKVSPTETFNPAPVGEISQTLKDLATYVNEVDFNKSIVKYKEAFKPKDENERFTDKFIKMLDKYGIETKTK